MGRQSLEQTKKRLGVGPARLYEAQSRAHLPDQAVGAAPKPASTTSDRIPGPAPSEDFMHAPYPEEGGWREAFDC